MKKLGRSALVPAVLLALAALAFGPADLIVQQTRDIQDATVTRQEKISSYSTQDHQSQTLYRVHFKLNDGTVGEASGRGDQGEHISVYGDGKHWNVYSPQWRTWTWTAILLVLAGLYVWWWIRQRRESDRHRARLEQRRQTDPWANDPDEFDYLDRTEREA